MVDTEDIKYVDSLVQEYLLFRGFTTSIKVLEQEKKSDRLKGYHVSNIVTSLFTMVHQGNLQGVRELWNHLNDMFFSRLEEDMSLTVHKLDMSLKRYYLVYSMQSGHVERALEFFKVCSMELATDKHWKLWFVLPYVKSPEQDPNFAIYFTKTWVETFTLSLHNFLSTIFQNVPLPKILNFNTERKIRLSLQHLNDSLMRENESLRTRNDKLRFEVEKLNKALTAANTKIALLEQQLEAAVPTAAQLALLQHQQIQYAQQQQQQKGGLKSPGGGTTPSSTATTMSTNSSSSSSSSSGNSGITSASSGNADGGSGGARRSVMMMQTSTPGQLGNAPSPSVVSGGVLSSPSHSAASGNIGVNTMGHHHEIAPGSVVLGGDADGSAHGVTSSGFSSHLLSSSNSSATGVGVGAGGVYASGSGAVATSSHPMLLQTLKTESFSMNSALNCCKYSPDGNYIACGTQTGVTRIWPVGAQTHRSATIYGNAEILSLAWDRDSKVLLVGSADGKVKVWNVAMEKAVGELSLAPYARIKDIVCSPIGNTFAVAACGLAKDPKASAIHLLNAKTMQVQSKLEFPNVIINSFTFNHNESLIVAGGSDGFVTIIATDTKEPMSSWKAHTGPVLNVSYSPDYTCIYTVGADSKLQRWDAHTNGKLIKQYLYTGPAEGSKRVDIAFSEESTTQHTYFIVPSKSETAPIYDRDTTTPLVGIGQHKAAVTCCDWHPALCQVMTGCLGGVVCLTTLIPDSKT